MTGIPLNVFAGSVGKCSSFTDWRDSVRDRSEYFAHFFAIAMLLSAAGGHFASAQTLDNARWSKLAEPVFRLVAYSEGQLFDADQGLPFTEIPTALAEDREGFLWVGTQNGLERWDGYRFHTFLSTGRKSGELPDSFIQVLHVDAKGVLWIGTNAGGLARYDRDHDGFVHIATGRPGPSGQWVTAIDDDGAGGVWVGTSDGLIHIDADGIRIVHYKHRDDDVGSLPDDYVRALLCDQSGALWVATAKGLVRRDSKAEAFVPVQLPSVTVPVSLVRTLFQASDGRIWIGTRYDGAYFIAPNSLVAQPLSGTRASGSDIRKSEILSASETDSGEVWLGTNGQGIIAVDPASLRTRLIAHNPMVPTSLPDDSVWALYRDRSGLIWIGSGHGISYYNPQHAIETVFRASAAKGVAAGDVIAMFAMRDGQIALAAGHDGADFIDPEATRVRKLRPYASRPETSLPQDNVTAFAATDDGDLFIGTRRGLYLADRSLRSVSRVPIAGDDPAPPIWSLLYAQNRLWVGGPYGVLQLTRRAGEPSRAPRWNVVDRVDVRRASAIAPASGGAIWIGTMNGLFRFDPTSRSLKPQPFTSGEQVASRAHLVTSLLTDRDGQLWIGTNGEGIFVLETSKTGGDSLVPRLHIDESLPNSAVDALLQDGGGSIWASTDNGVAEINPHNGAVQAVERGDGLAIASYWLGSGLTTSHGELLFGGQGGFTVIRPDRFEHSTYSPSIVVTSITVGNTFIPSSRYNDAGQKNSLLVPSDAKSFTVEFAALDYLAPASNRYAYKLDGYDRDWIPENADRRMAAYTNLSPGNYLLHVRGSNHAGVWAPTELALPIEVEAAWYQTRWFRLGEIICAFAVIAVIVQGRTMMLRHRQRELVELVNRRTQELAHSNDERRALIENVAHDLRTPLTSLRGYLETAILKEAELSASDRQQYLAIALRQSENLMRLVRELFDLVRLEEAGIKISREPFQLGELVQDAVQKFGIVAANRNISMLVRDIPELPRIVGDIMLMERLIDNLLENAIRHTPDGGHIVLSLASVDRQIQLDISDTGQGIRGTDIKSIFDRFRRGGDGNLRESAGAGLGLAIVKRIVDLHGGHISVQSDVGIGTCFSIRFPVQPF
jgi:signal transduction histidine kinase/ligand-binding sensor domain-containing protein